MSFLKSLTNELSGRNNLRRTIRRHGRDAADQHAGNSNARVLINLDDVLLEMVADKLLDAGENYLPDFHVTHDGVFCYVIPARCAREDMRFIRGRIFTGLTRDAARLRPDQYRAYVGMLLSYGGRGGQWAEFAVRELCRNADPWILPDPLVDSAIKQGGSYPDPNQRRPLNETDPDELSPWIDPATVSRRFIALGNNDSDCLEEAAECIDYLNNYCQPRIWEAVPASAPAAVYILNSTDGGFPDVTQLEAALEADGLAADESIIVNTATVRLAGKSAVKLFAGFSYWTPLPLRIVFPRTDSLVPQPRA
jgi:hypothetical protein